MKWMSWQKPVAQELSEQLKKHLISEFTLDTLSVGQMRFSGKKGQYSNRPVRYIRIYDPILIKDSESATLSYDALAQKASHGAALLFDGRIEANKQVYLTDHRAPATL